MAIATLALCYNNPSVFTGVVKIRKGQAVGLMMQSTDMDNLRIIFTQYAEEVLRHIYVLHGYSLMLKSRSFPCRPRGWYRDYA